MVHRVQTGWAVLSTDDEFDEQLPRDLQIKSPTYFTPLEVARQAATLLAPEPGMSVLDVGAGAGKFCLAAALAVPTATFVGVELRGDLVRLASRLATQLGLQNVRFVHADALELDWSQFDSFYFFNPFAEHLFESAFVLDHSIKLDPSSFVLYVMEACQRLARARIGTRLVTYHGFGAPPPLGYDLACRGLAGSDRMELWIKTHEVTAYEVPEDVAA